MGADAANPGATPGADDGGRAQGIDDALRELNAARRETVDAARGTVGALQRLAAADFELARSALGRGLAWAGLAALLGSSAWLLLTGVLVAGLHALGLDWVWCLLIVAGVYLAGVGLCVWRMRGYLEHIGMQATRRQLSRLRGRAVQKESAAAPPPPPAPAAQGAE